MTPNNNATGTSEIKWLTADWPAPPHVHAGITLRNGGVSSAPYDQLNLAMHVADDPDNVRLNRKLLLQHLNLPAEPVWLQQVHGNKLCNINSKNIETIADGSCTNQINKVCAVMTADCLPLLLCDDRGTQIAAIHIGWRGFCKNIISAALDTFPCANDKLIAWLGPCICAKHYETGSEVRDACLAVCEDAGEAFTSIKKAKNTNTEHLNTKRWQTDIRKLVTLHLMQQGVRQIYGEQRCTFAEEENFFSYRKHKHTGRMASLIWMSSNK